MIRRFFSSKALKPRKFLFASAFKGEPTAANFELVDVDLPAVKDGEVLTEALYLSVDPYMRPYMAAYKPPCTMIGGQVARYC
jgi:prostaglandin reductase 1